MPISLKPSVHHKIPEDMKTALTASDSLALAWNELTPIARNEWICWVTIVKKDETRKEHIDRMCSELREGGKRPCCWPGCPHRRPKAARWFSST